MLRAVKSHLEVEAESAAGTGMESLNTSAVLEDACPLELLLLLLWSRSAAASSSTSKLAWRRWCTGTVPDVVDMVVVVWSVANRDPGILLLLLLRIVVDL